MLEQQRAVLRFYRRQQTSGNFRSSWRPVRLFHGALARLQNADASGVRTVAPAAAMIRNSDKLGVHLH